MKKKMMRAIALLMGLGTAAIVGCGGDGDKPNSESGNGGGNGGAATKIVIYAGGSSEFSWVAGSAENEVIDYVEEKYYQATGNKLDFEIAYLGNSMHSKLESELAAGSQVDVVISHTRGGVGIDDKLRGTNKHYNINEALQDFAPNLYKHIEGEPVNALTDEAGDVIAIPSVINPYKFGILVRKDLMEAVGYTDDAAKAQTEFKTGVNYQLVDDLKTFEAMCLAMKEANNMSHVITGASWDLEKAVVLGAYTNAGYFTNKLVEEGENSYIRRGGATDEYAKVIETEYRWANNGIVSKDANNILLEQAEQNFVSGKTAVFVQDPTVQHLIKVARMTKKNVPEAEFTVLGALTSGEIDPVTGTESTKKGFMRNMQATFGAAITASSKNMKDVLKFMNWVYSSEENYNLCRYGLEGTHWVDNGDGTYSYPAGKEGYETAPAYSGILTFVENQNISNLTYKGYSTEELRWINDVAGKPANYVTNDVVDYIFSGTDSYNIREASATSALYEKIGKFWTGEVNPMAIEANGKTIYKNLIDNYNNAILDVQAFYADQYNYMKSTRGA